MAINRRGDSQEQEARKAKGGGLHDRVGGCLFACSALFGFHLLSHSIVVLFMVGLVIAAGGGAGSSSPIQRGGIPPNLQPAAAICALTSNPPCGNVPQGPPSVELKPGQTFTVVFQKNVNHYYGLNPGNFTAYGEWLTRNLLVIHSQSTINTNITRLESRFPKPTLGNVAWYRRTWFVLLRLQHHRPLQYCYWRLRLPSPIHHQQPWGSIHLCTMRGRTCDQRCGWWVKNDGRRRRRRERNAAWPSVTSER